MKKKLKLLAVEGRLINDHKAADAGVSRCIGYRYDMKARGYVSTGQPQEVDFLPEYLEAVKNGDLKAFDKETADICGVQFTNVK